MSKIEEPIILGTPKIKVVGVGGGGGIVRDYRPDHDADEQTEGRRYGHDAAQSEGAGPA